MINQTVIPKSNEAVQIRVPFLTVEPHGYSPWLSAAGANFDF
jgi:hypothetical protein